MAQFKCHKACYKCCKLAKRGSADNMVGGGPDGWRMVYVGQTMLSVFCLDWPRLGDERRLKAAAKQPTSFLVVYLCPDCQDPKLTS